MQLAGKDVKCLLSSGSKTLRHNSKENRKSEWHNDLNDYGIINHRSRTNIKRMVQSSIKFIVTSRVPVAIREDLATIEENGRRREREAKQNPERLHYKARIYYPKTEKPSRTRTRNRHWNAHNIIWQSYQILNQLTAYLYLMAIGQTSRPISKTKEETKAELE